MDTSDSIDSPQDEVPQAMAFTVTFETASAKKPNKFIKKHSRNLSLPVVNVYENNVCHVNGKAKKPGNHSEGYFSSDPEDELTAQSTSSKITVTPTDEFNNFNIANTMVLPEINNEEGSDVGSDTGTYTIDKESPEVVTARLSLDTTFGIDPMASVCTKQEAKAWISEWASTTVNHKNSYNSSSSTFKHPKALPVSKISKIPSPMTKRASLGTRGIAASSISKPDNVPKKELLNDNNLETESYLKTTEKVMSALAARMSLSLDSGGESDADSKSSNKKSLQRSDSSASESGPKTRSETRYNRAFSLRRGRLDDDSKKQDSPPKSGIRPAMNSTPRPSRSKPVTPIMPPPSGLTRTDNARLSLRSKAPPQSPVLSGPKSDNGKKKSSGRSNSTLSSKEVDFQNWKRRKSYDPMKAAAEGKKKEAAKKVPANALTQSVGPVEASTPKSPVSVLRSASFHGTRQLVGPSSSEEDEEITLSPEEEDWPATQAPKTSLENTPRGSRVSLYSNNSNSPRARHKLEGVDNIVVSAILGLSNKLKGNTSILVQKLRYLYDEESDKHKCLSLELEQLEMAENSSSPQKSSSKELAVTLKNLKRIDTTLKVLNEVVFENLDYE